MAEYVSGYGLAMLIFGEFNVFRPTDAAILLDKAWGALSVGGQLLLEPHLYCGFCHCRGYKVHQQHAGVHE